MFKLALRSSVFIFCFLVSTFYIAHAQNRAEYFFDTDPGIGRGQSLTVPTGDSVVFNQAISVSSLATGFHSLYVRTRMNGRWSIPASTPFYIQSASSLTSGPITALEYFFDTDPGVGNGTNLSISPSADSATRNAVVPIGSLSTGFHTLYVRAKNNRGYSLTESRTFFITSASTASAGPISSLEYFFDTDPGVGNGTSIAINPSADSSSRTAIIPIGSLPNGFHTMYVRAKNNRGYSLTEARTFFIVSASSSNAGPINQIEYFFDTDPGIGNGTKLAVSPAGDSITRIAAIPISSLSSGFHTLYVRAKNNTGFSQTEARTFFIIPPSAVNSGPISRMEYFIDTDPGVGLGTPISPSFASTDSVDVSRVITLSANIAQGAHKLYIRTQTSDKRWAITEVEDFTVDCGEISITATQTQICSGQSTTLSITLGNVPGNFQWYRNGTLISGATNFNLTTTQTGTYTLRYENGTCVDTSNALVIGVGSSVVATITPSGSTQLCASTSVNLNATIGNGLSYQWLLNENPISGQTTIQLANVSAVGSYKVIVTNATGCKDTSEAVVVSISPGVGDPAVFPQDVWNVYGYSGADLNLGTGTLYRGFYSVNSVNINTQDQWGAGFSPSSASGYQGCIIPADNFTFVLKRKGFPNGSYLLNIADHDDFVRVYVNGNQVFEFLGCCTAHPNITLGNLDANSTVEVRVMEGTGSAQVNLVFSQSGLQAGTIAGNQAICNAGTPAIFSSTQNAFGGSTTTINYQWQDSTAGGNWQNISNATGSTFQSGSLTATRWFRRIAFNGAAQAISNEIQVIINNVAGDPSVFPQGSWNVYAYQGTDINLGTGNAYRGFYSIINSLNVNTVNQWDNSASPSSATGYEGCPVATDNFSFVLKRRGFPSGNYAMNVVAHDDQIRILVNGSQVFERLSCCTSQSGIDLGFLDGNSTVEIRAVEFGGGAVAHVEFVTSDFQGGTIAANQTICTGKAPNLITNESEASGGGAGTISYQWQDSTSNGAWQNIQNATNPTFQPGVLNASRWFRRRANSGNLVAFSNEVSISVLPNPTVNISPAGPFAICNGELRELTATATNGSAIQWLRNGAVVNGQISSSFFASQSGTYRAVATIGNQCTDTSNAVVINVNPKPAPVLNLDGPQSICSNGNLTLTLTNPQTGQTNQWKRDGSPIQGGNSITISTPGFYYVVSTISATGCKDSTAGVTLNVVDPIITPAGPVQICQGSSTNLIATNTGTGTLKWLRNEVEIPGAANQTITISQAGIYKVVVTLAGLCTDTSSGVSVIVNSLPTASITALADSFCVGGATVLRANQGNGLTYQWKRNGGNIANANADTLLVNVAGSYTVEVRNAANCLALSEAKVINQVNNISWFLDVDNDGYGTGNTVSSCSRPLNGFLAGELTATTGDCNDLDPTINPSRQFFSYAGGASFNGVLCSPIQGTPYTTFRFETIYTDLNNNPPPVTFPRVILDFEGNGQLNGPNDRTILMQEFDNADKTYSDGKRYFTTVNSLPSGQNYTTRIVSNIGTCGTTFGPFNYPDVFILSDLQIFANDISFSNPNPPVSSPLTVSAIVHNVSDFAAENFVVHLVNQFDTTIVYPDIVVPFLAPQSSTTVSWDITTPNVPAWCPMQVFVDWTNVITETNELDNNAIRPFVNGNFNVPGNITVGPTVSPSTVVGVQGATATLTGTAIYTNTAVPLQNPSVAGAQVTFTIQPGGQTFTTYTNSSGQINFAFLVGTTPGVYTITGTITDFTLTTNFTTTFTVVPPVCLPDLVANLTVSSINIVEGESISGNLRIRNLGCQDVLDSTLVKFTQSGGSPSIPNVKIPPLAVGASFDIPINSITFSTPGTFSICGLADGDFEIEESAEFNNQDCRIITVIPFLPDIFPTSCGVGGQMFITGQPSNITINLANSGGSATGLFNVRVRILQGSTVLETINQPIANLGRQSSTSFTFQYTYPAPGTYSVQVYCDTPEPNGVVQETNETNNGSNCSILILATQPDLFFGSGCENIDVDPTDPAFPGDVTIKARLFNGGNSTANAPILVRFTQSGGAIHEVTLTENLAAGQSVMVSKVVPAVAPATETISVVVDPDNTISEFQEGNNSAGPKSLCHEFAPIDNFCGGNWWNGTYLINQAIFLNVPVNVSGVYDASQLKVRFFVSGPGLNGTLNLGDAILNNVSELCSCPISATLPVSFAFPQEGEYTFTFVTDPDNEYTECDETNNTLVRKAKVSGLPDMRVLSQLINPSKLNPEVNEPITIQGNYENIGLSNIDQTMKFKLLVDEIAVDSATVNGLVTRDNFTVNFTTPWSSNVVGAHIIRTIIDADNQIQESNEINNEATRAVIVGAAANMYFQVFLPSNGSPTLGQQINIATRIGNNGDEDVNGLVQFFYINDQNDTIQIGQLPVFVAGNDSTNLTFPWTVVDNNTVLIGKIVNADIMEFDYDDNMATAQIGGFSLSFTSTPSCGSTPNGTLTVSANGGNPPFTARWSNGFVGLVLSAGAGTYQVSVTDGSGVTVNGSATINALPGVRYFLDADGDGYGNPAIDTVDCVQPQGYVRNNLDCNDGNQAVYKSTPKPEISSNQGSVICQGNSASISVNNPVQSLTYTWSTNSVGSSILINATGSYSVVASQDSGCAAFSDTISIQVVTAIVPTAVVFRSVQGPICKGASVTFTATVSGQGAQPRFEWFVNAMLASTGISYETDSLQDGDVVQFILNSSESCANPVEVEALPVVVTVLDSILAFAGSDQSLCGTSAQLAGNEVSGASGTWTLVSGTAQFSNVSDPSATVNGLSPGLNRFRWTLSNGACPPVFDEVDIQVSPSGIVSNAGVDQLFCETDSTRLQAVEPSAGAGAWSVVTGSGQISNPNLTTALVEGLSYGENKLVWTVTSGNCEPLSDTVVITRFETPAQSFAGSDVSSCADQTTLAGNSPQTGTGAWTVISGTGVVSDSTLANSGVSNLSVGVNEFVWTISNGNCPASSDTVVITREEAPSQAIAGTDQSICANQTTLAGNTPQTGTGAWTVIRGTGVLSDSTLANSGVSNLSVGVNEFVWTISNANCPSSVDTLRITVAELLIADAGSPQIVCGQEAILAGNSPSNGTGSWTVISGSGTFADSANPITLVSGLSTGPNVFQWKVINGICLDDSASVIITSVQAPTPSMAGAEQSICGTNANLNGNVPVVGTGVWTLVSGAAVIADSLSPTSAVANLGLGDNVFRWTIINAPCPASFDEVTISGNAIPVANAGPDSVACDTVFRLRAVSEVGVSGLWTQISGTGQIVDPNNASTLVTGLGLLLNRFVWTATLGACSASDTVNIVVVNERISLGPDTTVCLDSTVTLSVPAGFASYIWSNGSNATSITVNETGTYFVTVTTPEGCALSDTILVTVTVCTSLKPALSAMEIAVNPNPFKEQFTLNVNHFSGRNLGLRLFSLNGTEVYRETIHQSRPHFVKEIYPGKLPDGLYILELESSGQVVRKKLVIQQ